MARFNPDHYEPHTDSSPGTKPTVGTVVLNVGERQCHDGCGQQPEGRNAKFRMGHDARLKGILIRAHATRTPINRNGKVTTALALAAEYDTDKFSWTAMVKDAAAAIQNRPAATKRSATKPAKKAAAKKAPAKAAASKTVQVKIGRWTYEGVVTGGEANGKVIVRYTDSKGQTKEVTVAKSAVVSK